MGIKVAVIKESGAQERRVALVPSVVPRIAKLGCDLLLEPVPERLLPTLTPVTRM